MLAGAALVIMFYLFGGGRQTDISTKEGSSQGRIQGWDTAFHCFRGSPLIGIGPGEFDKANGGHAAHNAFMQTYAELGFLGGTLLFGQYFYCLKNLTKLAAARATVADPVMRGTIPFLLACLASFATSEMSLTNWFGLVTYVMFGLASVGIRLANPSPPLPDLLLSGSLLRRIILYSGLFLVGLSVFVRLNVAY
jgi:O-antigen ligase